MKNSMIMHFLSEVYAFFTLSYANSYFKKCSDGIVAFLKKITENSFFVNFFSTPVKKGQYLYGRFFEFLFCLAGKLRSFFSKAAAPVKQSAFINAAKNFYSQLLFRSLRTYGIAAGTAIVVYSAVSIVSGAMTNRMCIFACLILFAGAVCACVETSAYNVFTSSIFVRAFGKLLGRGTFEKRPTIKLTFQSSIASAVFGIALAAAALITGPVYTLVFVLGILAVGWIIYDYSIGIYLAVVLLPFAPTMALVALIMLTFMSFILRFIFDEKMHFTHTPLDVPLVLFAGVLLVSALTSFAVQSSIMAVMVYMAFILSYFLLTNSIKTKQRLVSLIVLVLFAGLLVAAYGIYQHVFGFADGTVWTDTDMFSDIETRVVSTFENPNVLGEYLLLLIPIGLGIVWGTKKGYNKLIHFVIVGALSLCMIYTYSRGNWIGLLVAVFMFFMFYDRRFIWVGLAALLISPIFLPQNVINRFLSVGDMGDTSTSYRVYIWMGTLKMLKDYWFSGIGIGTEAFNRIYPLYAFSGVIAPHSHNLYLQIITENGIAGILMFLWLIVVYFKMCISAVISSEDRLLKGLITGLAAGMLGYLVQGMFDNVWYNYRVFLLFFVIIGITVACVNISDSIHKEGNE